MKVHQKQRKREQTDLCSQERLRCQVILKLSLEGQATDRQNLGSPNPLPWAQPLPQHLSVCLFPFPLPKIQLPKPSLFRNDVGFTDYTGRTNSVPPKKSTKKKEELDINEAENDTQVTKYSLIWGCRHLKLNNCLIPVINTLPHKPGRLYF